jgi:hypothetical protein
MIFALKLKNQAMKKNMGLADRLIRILAAIAIIALYAIKAISGTTAIILLIVAGIFILTSFISFCPLYLPFGISTRKKNS